MTMGDRICVMNDGEIKQVNRPIDIYESPADIFTAGFVGLPQMNFLNGRVVASTGSSGLDFISTSDHPIVISLEKNEEQAARLNEGMEVVLGVRPEHFILCGKEDVGAVEAVVEVREPLGAESFIYLRLPSGESLVIRLKGMINLEVGHSLFIKPDLNEIHLFNASTKERV
jgi:ABC-type sugar transport system ATPase subunit